MCVAVFIVALILPVANHMHLAALGCGSAIGCGTPHRVLLPHRPHPYLCVHSMATKEPKEKNPLELLLDSEPNDIDGMPAKLQALEDSIDVFCGKQSGVCASVLVPGHGEVKSKDSFRDCPDYKASLAAIHACK